MLEIGGALLALRKRAVHNVLVRAGKVAAVPEHDAPVAGRAEILDDFALAVPFGQAQRAIVGLEALPGLAHEAHDGDVPFGTRFPNDADEGAHMLVQPVHGGAVALRREDQPAHALAFAERIGGFVLALAVAVDGEIVDFASQPARELAGHGHAGPRGAEAVQDRAAVDEDFSAVFLGQRQGRENLAAAVNAHEHALDSLVDGKVYDEIQRPVGQRDRAEHGFIAVQPRIVFGNADQRIPSVAVGGVNVKAAGEERHDVIARAVGRAQPDAQRDGGGSGAEANLAAAGGIGVGLRAGGQRKAEPQGIAAVKSVPFKKGEAQQAEGRYRGIIPVDRRPVGLCGLFGPFVGLRGDFGERRAAPDASELSQLLQLQKVALYGLHGYVQRAGGRFAVTEPVAPHKSQQGFLPLSDNHFHHLMIQYSTKSNKNQQKE